MGWSWSGDPADSDKDTVRFYLGDVDQDRQMLTDEEIAFVVDKWMPIYNSPIFCAAVCAEVLAGRFAREVSVSADGVNVGTNELQSKYEQLAQSLRDQYKAEATANPLFNGTIFDDDWDSTIKPLVFGTGFTDNPWAGQQDFGGRNQQGAWPWLDATFGGY